MISVPLFNTEIHNFVSDLNLPHFKGVFSSNNIPQFNENYTIICNLSNVLEEGTHFVCVGRLNNNLIYFDPLALNIFNNDLEIYLNKEIKKCSNIMFLRYPIQSWLSQGCGYYCIFFVLLFHVILINNSFDDIQLLQFSKQLHRNDSICKSNITRLIKILNE